MSLGDAFEPVLAAAQLGEAWAWERLYRDVAPRLVGFIRGRGVADPDGVLGDVWLNVATGLAGFTGGEQQLNAWVFTIAHRRVADAHRASARRPTTTLSVDGREPASVERGPEDHALAAVATDDALHLLASLTEDQREVLLLRIFGELTLGEVAAATGRPEGAVKSLQHRALAALRRALDETSPPPVPPDPSTAIARVR